MSTCVEQYRGFVADFSDGDKAKAWCERFSKSSFCPVAYKNKPDEVEFACTYGALFGLSPLASVNNIAVINGKATIWGDALLGLVMRYCDNVQEVFDDSTWTATCRIWRRGFSIPFEASFSIEDAKMAGLANKGGPWKQYPKRMLAMRARGFAIRNAFPDLLNGIVTREEAEDMGRPRPIMQTPPPPVIEPDVIDVECAPPPDLAPVPDFEIPIPTDPKETR